MVSTGAIVFVVGMWLSNSVCGGPSYTLFHRNKNASQSEYRVIADRLVIVCVCVCVWVAVRSAGVNLELTDPPSSRQGLPLIEPPNSLNQPQHTFSLGWCGKKESHVYTYLFGITCDPKPAMPKSAGQTWRRRNTQ